ncbi:MAG: rod shape-determining protein MreD [Clostridiaceae bacterium]|nr:rod shape-determining protein MreD [Clostridiaceae bacterium]
MRSIKKYGRQTIIYAIYLLLLTIVQFTLSGWLIPVALMPDLALVFVIICGSFYGGDEGMIIGLIAGFLRDMLSGRVLGLGMLLLMFAGLAASGLFIKWFRRNSFVVILQIITISFFYELFIIGLTYLFPMLPDQIYSLKQLFDLHLRDSALQIGLNTAAAIPLMFLLHYLGPYPRGQKRTGMEEDDNGDNVWRTI